MPNQTKPVPLSLLGMSLMANTSGLSKDAVINNALSSLNDSEVSKSQGIAEMDRLLAIGLVQRFGQEFAVTARGREAVEHAKVRVESLYNLLTARGL